jgi:hypothetical protein
MNAIEHNLAANPSNLAVMPVPPAAASSKPPKLGALSPLKAHWPKYLMEAGLLGGFVVSAWGSIATFSACT